MSAHTRWRRLRLAAAATPLLLGLTARGAIAQEMAVPVDVQFSLFYRILSYDREAAARTENGLVICVPFQGRYRASKVAKNEAVRQFPPAEASYAVRFVPVDLDANPDLRATVVAAGCDILYVTPLRAMSLTAIMALCRERGILTFTGVPDYVDRGLSVGIGVNDDRPEILVNLAAATAEGAVFSAQLLRLARVQ